MTNSSLALFAGIVLATSSGTACSSASDDQVMGTEGALVSDSASTVQDSGGASCVAGSNFSACTNVHGTWVGQKCCFDHRMTCVRGSNFSECTNVDGTWIAQRCCLDGSLACVSDSNFSECTNAHGTWIAEKCCLGSGS
jgi:hypothetical protein